MANISANDDEARAMHDSALQAPPQLATSEESKHDKEMLDVILETRRQRNRQHARVSRERKQRQFEYLQEENTHLKSIIGDLERSNAVQFNEIQYLRASQQRRQSNDQLIE